MSLNRVIATASPQIASTAAVLGLLRAGPGCDLARGAVVRTPAGSVELGAFSALLENGVMIGTSEHPVFVGQKVVFGHRCVVVGSAIGDLCEIGNASILLAGARVGRGCILGEGTLVPPETVIPDETVVVGRPGRVVRRINDKDRERSRSCAPERSSSSVPDFPIARCWKAFRRSKSARWKRLRISRIGVCAAPTSRHSRAGADRGTQKIAFPRSGTAFR